MQVSTQAPAPARATCSDSPRDLLQSAEQFMEHCRQTLNQEAQWQEMAKRVCGDMTRKQAAWHRQLLLLRCEAAKVEALKSAIDRGSEVQP